MKMKFNQQKSFVKRVQEKLKKHTTEQDTIKQDLTTENEKLTNRVRELESFQTSHKQQKHRITKLQVSNFSKFSKFETLEYLNQFSNTLLGDSLILKF